MSENKYARADIFINTDTKKSYLVLGTQNVSLSKPIPYYRLLNLCTGQIEYRMVDYLDNDASTKLAA